MPADIVRIRVRLTTDKEFVNITCAVVEKLNYSLILGSDIVDKLNLKLMDEVPFDCLVMDCFGPLFSNQKVEYNYALVVCDSNTRYTFAMPLCRLNAKVCECIVADLSTSRHSIHDKIGLC